MVQLEFHGRLPPVGDAGSGQRERARPAGAGPSLRDAYAILGVDRGASDADVKRAYRRLLSQYFAFTTRTPEWANQVLSLGELRELAQDDRHVAIDLRRMEDILETSPGEAWGHARDAGHRISAARDGPEVRP